MTLEETVQTIIQKVRERGDAALCRYSKRFDQNPITPRTLEVTSAERKKAWGRVDPKTIDALKKGATRIERFHKKQRMRSWNLRESGLTVGQRWSPLDRVGIYVPGGLASYPSSVLMNTIPAKVAGVREIIMTTPFPNGLLKPAVLVAADIAGVDRIFKVGGAQAIAALAFGTQTIPRVDKIVGPGNRFVAEAKRQVFGKVAIDMIAGPSEVVIVADPAANPKWIAADLVAQAEHDPEARPIVISPSRSLLKTVRQEVEIQLANAGRRSIAEASFRRHGQTILVKNLEEACERVNETAPEHCELHVKNPGKLLPKIRHAGAIFLGAYSPVALGDFVAGPNHVLPTSMTARFSSPLGVQDFQKFSNIIQANRTGLKRLAPLVKQLAEAEGLTAHAESVDVRFR